MPEGGLQPGALVSDDDSDFECAFHSYPPRVNHSQHFRRGSRRQFGRPSSTPSTPPSSTFLSTTIRSSIHHLCDRSRLDVTPEFPRGAVHMARLDRNLGPRRWRASSRDPDRRADAHLTSHGTIRRAASCEVRCTPGQDPPVIPRNVHTQHRSRTHHRRVHQGGDNTDVSVPTRLGWAVRLRRREHGAHRWGHANTEYNFLNFPERVSS